MRLRTLAAALLCAGTVAGAGSFHCQRCGYAIASDLEQSKRALVVLAVLVVLVHRLVR